MTGPGLPHEVRPLAGPGPGTTARRPATGGGFGSESPDDPTERAFATHKPCPVDGCLGPARLPTRSQAHLPALDHDDLDHDHHHDHNHDHDHDTVLCRRCGARPDAPAEV
jgi:hypothetical protein